jgi:hypothetical protein
MTVANYFDSSALVKRYLAETGSTWVQARCSDPTHVIVTADLARVEIAAAFARKLREGAITQAEYQAARARLVDDVHQRFQIIPVTSQRIDEAIELTTRRPLRGYDAVHLACALHANRMLLANNLQPLVLIAADGVLLEAAETEGLDIENPNLHA